MELMTPVKTIGELDATVRRLIYSLLEDADEDYSPTLRDRAPGLWEYYESLLGYKAILAFDGESKLAGICVYDTVHIVDKSGVTTPLIMIISKSYNRQAVDRLLRKRLDEITSTAEKIAAYSK